MLAIITRVLPAPPQALELTFADGTAARVDLSPQIAMGGVFSALKDPHVFSGVLIGEGGRFLEWPGGVDLCADALRLAATNGSGDGRGSHNGNCMASHRDTEETARKEEVLCSSPFSSLFLCVSV
jgi:hypothetical protein